MKLAITSSADFIGLNFVRYLRRKYPSDSVQSLDGLTYPGNLEVLPDLLGNPGYQFLGGDT